MTPEEKKATEEAKNKAAEEKKAAAEEAKKEKGDMKAVMDRLADLEEKIEEKDDQIAALEAKTASPYDRKDEGDGPGNPNMMLYKGKAHKQFHPADVKKALKDGWSTEPDKSAIRTKTKG